MSSNNKNPQDIFAFSKEIHEQLFRDNFICNDENIFQYDSNKYLYKQLTNAFFKKFVRKSIIKGAINASNELGEGCVYPLTENIKALLDCEDLSENNFIGIKPKRNTYFFPLHGTVLEIRIIKNNIAFIEHKSSSKFFTTKTVPYIYDKRAGCKTFIKFLKSILAPKEILLLQEWFGYTLIPTTKIHKMMIYKGRGRNGKSVVLLLHKLLLGILNVSSVPIKGFSPTEKFLLGHTENKLLNQVEEVDSDLSVITSVIKRYVSGGIVQGEPKFKMAKDFTPTARIEIATNHDVNFEDDSDGFRERLIILPFLMQFLGRDQNKDLIDPDFWIDSGELSGVFNWSLRGLSRLVSNDWNFTEVESVNAEINEYKRSLNYTADFINNYLEVAPPEEKLFGSDMRDVYEAYCYRKGLVPKSSSTFSKELLTIYPSIVKDKDATPTKIILKHKPKVYYRSHIFHGVRFKVDPEAHTGTQVTGRVLDNSQGGVRETRITS